MTTQDSSTYWKLGRVELRAAGFDPDRAAQTSAVVTIGLQSRLARHRRRLL
ncbi:MAG: hypothetical protein JF604_27510 [Bradyrhizobium sp.]|nr:hypothetical protein [Bradyrhizobium sp.]